jgi:hypothetical protein
MVASFSVATTAVGSFTAFAIPTFKELAGAVKLLATETEGMKAKDLKEYNKVVEELKKTNPLLFAAAEGFEDLKDNYMGFAKELQPEVLKSIGSGFSFLNNLMEKTFPIADETADAINRLIKEADAGLDTREWKTFFRYVERNADGFTTTWGRTVGNFVTGIANMISAFDPLTKFVNKGFLGMSRSFRDWSDGLEHNGNFQDFVQFVKTNGPVIWKNFMDISKALSRFVIELTPLMGDISQELIPILIDLLDTGTDLLKMWNSLPDPIKETAIEIGVAVFVLSKLNGLLGATGPGLLAVGRNGITAGRGINAMNMAVRGAVAAGGMALFISQAQDTNEEISVLSGAIAGGAMGSMFGPWGMAIGAAGGALGTWIHKMTSTSDHIKSNFEPSVEHLATTFDTLTGKITEATKATVYQGLEEDKAFDAAQRLGVSRHTLTNAIMGNKRAQDLVNDAIHRGITKTHNLKDASGNLTEEGKKWNEAWKDLSSTMDRHGVNFQNASGRALDLRDAMFKYRKELKGWPTKLVTRLEAEGLPRTMRDVRELAVDFNILDRKKIKTLIELSGAKPTEERVDRIKALLKSLEDVDPNMRRFEAGLMDSMVTTGTGVDKHRDKIWRSLMSLTTASPSMQRFINSVTQGTEAARRNAKGKTDKIFDALLSVAGARANMGPFGSNLNSQLGGIAKNAHGQSVGIGNNIESGINSGLSSAWSSVKNTAAGIVNAAIAAANAAAKAKSPSRRTMELGKYMGQGLAIGMEREIPNIERISSKTVRDAVAAMRVKPVRIHGALDIPDPISKAAKAQASYGSALSFPMGLGGGGGRNVNIYRITVQAPVGSSSAEIGRTLVKHIEAFEESGGRKKNR